MPLNMPRARTKFPCYFCNELKRELKEHFFSIHKDEARISGIMKLEKNEQKTQIALLKNEGIIKYNKNRPTAEKIGARLSKKPEKTCLVTCSKCYMSLTKKGLRSHVDKCKF